MKKRVSIVLSIMCACAIILCGCSTHSNNRITDVNEYGKLKGSDAFPTFFPDSIEGYMVDSYIYTTHSFRDDCYEVYLSMMVTEEQLEQLLKEVRRAVPTIEERQAYYADGYIELVIADKYTPSDDADDDPFSLKPPDDVVWDADIQKVVYNPDTGAIIFEYFDAFDSGVYPLAKVAFFSRFGINHFEYAQYLAQLSFASITNHSDHTYSYEITGYDGQILACEENLIKQPKRQYVSEDVVGVCIQMGTGLMTNRATYYDLQNGTVSETFHYVIAAKNNCVVYADYRDGEHILIVQDIFDKERRYEEYRPKDVSSVKADFVVKGGFNKKGNVNITYLSGEDYTETNFTIVI